MNVTIAVHTDIGIKKETNQDSLFVKTAKTAYGTVAMLAVCDGMGGLSKGELASATLVRSLDRWFMHALPALLYQNGSAEQLQESFGRCIEETNAAIADYGRVHHMELGTTLAALLLIGSRYYIANVGDSRVYLLTDKAWQITKDQTFVQREMDAGRMTAHEAKEDARRNMLLQCIGASQTVLPDFYSGETPAGAQFLLCSDGFRHQISEEEIYAVLHADGACVRSEMEEKLVHLTEVNKQRQEVDNISSILVQCD